MRNQLLLGRFFFAVIVLLLLIHFDVWTDVINGMGQILSVFFGG